MMVHGVGVLEAYQSDGLRLMRNSMAPSFRVDKLRSYRSEDDTHNHCWESLAKVPYLFDLH